MKDADKLKLMLLAWNYQNSNAGNLHSDEKKAVAFQIIYWNEIHNKIKLKLYCGFQFEMEQKHRI